ncbi:hypothetical protein BGZ83_010084, partial [Gryganskiella cystojenkinii]
TDNTDAMIWLRSQALASLFVGLATLNGIHSAYVLDSFGDNVGTGKNYKIKCAQGTVKLTLDSDTWEYASMGSGSELVVKFCKSTDCSRGSPVVDTDEYIFYTQRPRGPGYAAVSSHEIGSNWWVSTRSAGFGSPMMVEGSHNKYYIKQAGYYWTQENKSTYISLRSKGFGDMSSCSFVYAGEDPALHENSFFREEFGPHEDPSFREEFGPHGDATPCEDSGPNKDTRIREHYRPRGRTEFELQW